MEFYAFMFCSLDNFHESTSSHPQSECSTQLETLFFLHIFHFYFISQFSHSFEMNSETNPISLNSINVFHYRLLLLIFFSNAVLCCASNIQRSKSKMFWNLYFSSKILYIIFFFFIPLDT